MSRAQVEKSGYLGSFPGLLGCVCGLHGSEEEIDAAVARFGAGGDWTGSLSPSDLVLAPAACYPVYPIAAARGAVPAAGWLFDVAADCFRREPSRDLDRLQSFRMREYVCIGDPDRVSDFRERWIERAQNLARELGLAFTVEQANDPFFGRLGRMKAMSQKQQALKFELLVPLRGDEGKPTACMSFNYHRDHFGLTWDIRTAAGTPAHTACVAFGMDRLALAMFHIHGTDVARWPCAVRDLLGFSREGGERVGRE
jgi:seryl-tRNA synthetase